MPVKFMYELCALLIHIDATYRHAKECQLALGRQAYAACASMSIMSTTIIHAKSWAVGRNLRFAKQAVTQVRATNMCFVSGVSTIYTSAP